MCVLCVQSSDASSSSDDVMTVDVVLQKLTLTDYVDRFHSEQIDLDALVSIIRLTTSLHLRVFCAH